MAENKFGLWATVKDESELVRDLTATVDHFRKLAVTRLEKEKRLMRLYNPDPSGNVSNLVDWLKRDWPQFNLIRQGVDTMLAQVASQRYLPRYVITEGAWELGRVARLRTRVLEGQIEDLDIPGEMLMAAFDAYIGCASHLVGYLDEKSNPRMERALPGEITWDPRSAVHGSLTRVFRRRPVHRDQIVDTYNVKSHLLDGAAKATDTDRALLDLPKDSTLEEIRVDEAWAAPVGKRKGRHVICTSKTLLLEEEWDGDVPVIPVYYQRRQVGHAGIGIGEILQDEQIRLDRLLSRISDCQEIESTLYVVASSPQQRFSSEKMKGTAARIIRASGGATPPTITLFQGQSAPLVQEVDRIRERALSVLGISQMSAENKKPEGVNSAIAQRTFDDLTQKRQRQIQSNFKAAWLGVIKCLEHLNARAQAKNGGFALAARTTAGTTPLVKTVKWSEAHLPPEQYRLSLQLVSETPYTVGGRTEALTEWIASGYSSRPYSQKQLLESPNEIYQQLETADLDFVMWQLETILDGGEAELEPYQNPQLAADTARRVYLTEKVSGAPEEVLAKIRAFIDQAMPEQAAPAVTPPGGVLPSTTAPAPQVQAGQA